MMMQTISRSISWFSLCLLLISPALVSASSAEAAIAMPHASSESTDQSPIDVPAAVDWMSSAASEPTDRAAAFYYPWYSMPELSGDWVHWQEGGFHPPLDISSDYYPLLGAYSVLDPSILAQHFRWLRQARVGLIISSWWGRGSFEDEAIPLLLDVAAQYDIKVAFHIEPYRSRNRDQLVNDIRYLYDRYGDHSAFYRTTASSRWSTNDRSKGLFFLWSIASAGPDGDAVSPDYWQPGLNAIHAFPDGGIVIANTTSSEAIDAGHFDGLYNYATLDLTESDGFRWARSLPPDAWYVPSVIPGFSAQRIQYPEETTVCRCDGEMFDAQWAAALEVGVEPALVTITSFNEWHEGTQIEPAAIRADNGLGFDYLNYGQLSPIGYLRQTANWVDRFLAISWPTTVRVRYRIVTSSDWTTFRLVSGADWMRPSSIAASETATFAGLEADHFLLQQPIERAQSGEQVEMSVEVSLANVDSESTLVFEIERGHIGATTVELSIYAGEALAGHQSFTWDGINPGARNAQVVEVNAAELINQYP
ncbi:MAG: hypothetical protein KJ065_23650 [Anaerolineae bacterium]|nr:hypothetical protein [Anaerolineae bacterium]